MPKLKVAFIKELMEKQLKGEISFSKMVEIINKINKDSGNLHQKPTKFTIDAWSPFFTHMLPVSRRNPK